MPDFLGIDTSNYTTSAAVYRSETGEIFQRKMLLPVKTGELGLRQSDAVFHHTRQLPLIMEELFSERFDIKCVTASVRPRNADGSYMPCFLCGEGLAKSLSAVLNVPMKRTSHQTGHILAALYSADRLELVGKSFIAFHVSGGTTDCLLCSPDKDKLIKIEEIASSLDLKGGQAVDRVGLMLGMGFPCGRELEQLALTSTKSFKIKPVLKGMDCCLSGVENKCAKMLADGEKPCDIALYCLEYISASVAAMTRAALEKYGRLPLVYAGGVMSNGIIRGEITAEFEGASFAMPEFSCDNAAGTAIYGAFGDTR